MTRPKARKPLPTHVSVHNEPTRIRVRVGYSIVDVGPRAVVVSRIRRPTEEEKRMTGHQNDEAIVDNVTIRFDDSDQVEIESHRQSIDQ